MTEPRGRRGPAPKLDLGEFLGAYLAEVDEHLATARTKLLAIDEAARARPPGRAPREVRDAFRALHTIKGLSAMVGVESVVTLAHRMETVLRAADRSGVLPLELATGLLLDGVRVVERSIESVGRGSRAGEPPPPSLLEALDALEHSEEQVSSPPAALDLEAGVAAKLASYETEQLQAAASAGKVALRVEFVPSADRAGRGVTITHVREALGAFTEIVKIVPVSAAGGLRFVILLVAPVGAEARVAEAVEQEESAVHALLLPAPEVKAPAEDALDHDELPPPSVEDDLEEELQPYRRNLLRVDVARVDDAMEKLAALIVTRSRLTREVSALAARGVEVSGLAAIMTDNARQLRDLRAALLGLRMVPVGDVLDRLPLVVQGLRRSTGKRVRLDLDGTSEELDKSIAERLLPGLLHLVRNAVDHGLESPAERARAGKREEGTVRIACSSRNNRQLEIVVSDDGRGIDRAEVARRAHRDPSRVVSDRDLLETLCQPGLSTRTEVTTTSGRGMGMDIVRRIVHDLGGELSLTTTVGEGTRFSLSVPLTLTIVDAFSFHCAGQRFVVPVGAIDEIVELDPKALQRPASLPGVRASGPARDAVLMQRRGETVVLLDLAGALGLVGDVPRTAAFVVRRNGDAVAFAVERVAGQQEAVVRPLRDPLVQVPGVAGTTDLGDGRATMVLDLAALASGGRAA